VAGFWTDPREQSARELFTAGHSASQAAAALSAEFGLPVTRNAVIGLWHRRKWSGGENRQIKFRADAAARAGAQRAKRERVKLIVPAGSSEKRSRSIQRLMRAPHGTLRIIETTQQGVSPLREVEVVPLHVSLLDLQHGQCRYPYGDGPFTFCGCQAEPGRPYCEPHQYLCTTVYASASPDQRRSAAQKRAWANRKAREAQAA
jgi:GcrA cell cycle regulator